ncbi:MAG: nucleotidyltransferase family protein [Saprospiraceae bacterium]|nr:nucleotidyltransferase family protein [Saprospiraceae bacterium]
MKHSLKDLIINKNETVLKSIQQMDKLMRKLLIVVDEENKFISVVSIGDIQRAILKNIDLSTDIFNILRKDAKTATTDDNYNDIKNIMLRFRMEYMPVIDTKTQLVNNIIFWEDLFDENYLKQKDNKLNGCPVVIMAGGEGTRLRPITNIIPKPLVPLGSKPIAEVIIDNFCRHGVSDFFFTVNYKANMIQQYFEDIDHPYNIGFVHEKKPLGTAGSLSMLKDKIKTTFFVSNCDILIDDDYTQIMNYHKENENLITAVGAIKNYAIPYGTFETVENGVLISLNEKPNFNFLVNTGFYILEPEVLELIPNDKLFHITHLMEKVIKNKGKVGVFPVSEKSWMDIGVWEEYNKTQKLMEKKRQIHD